MPATKRRPGVVLTSTPKFKPRRDRAVKVTSVPCPTCKAAIGVKCTTLDGKPTQHRLRRVMALRAEQR